MFIYVYVNCNSNIEQKVIIIIIIIIIFFFLSNCDGASLGVGALCKLLTLRIGSAGTAPMDAVFAQSLSYC